MSAKRKAATVVLVAAALTVGPAAGVALASPVPADGSTCTQTSSNGTGSSSTSGGPSGGPSDGSSSSTVDLEMLRRAQELVAQTRDLLTTLITSSDPRAGQLVEQFRAMGITPAVASGWRQQAHDLSDRLLTNPDPAAAQVAVALAGSGYSATPADLRTGTATPAAAMPAADPSTAAPAQSVPVVNAAQTAAAPPLTSTGAMAAALAGTGAIALQAADAAGQADANSSGSGLQMCGQSAGKGGSGGSSSDGPTSTGGGSTTQEPPPAAPSPGSGTGPGGGSGPGGPASSGSPGSGSSSSGSRAQDWQQQAQDLVDELTAADDDPDAKALADKLKAAGVAGSSGEAGTGRNNVAGGTQSQNNTPDGGSSGSTGAAAPSTGGDQVADAGPSDSSTGQSSENGATSPAGSSDSPHLRSGSSGSGRSTPGTAASGTADSEATGSWEDQAAKLAQQLAAANDDPTAQQLADQLRAAGIAVPAGGNSTSADPTGSGSNGTTGSSSTGSAGAGSSSPQGDKPATGSSDAAPAGGPGAAPTATAAPWDQLARCESGGDWTTATGNGYAGGLQFDAATWKAYGGDQYAPSADQASKDQQIAVAEKVRRDRGGYSAWPACSKRLGLG
jgi:hypothetical protein